MIHKIRESKSIELFLLLWIIVRFSFSVGLVLVAQTVKNLPAICRRHGFDPLVRKIPWRREWLPTSLRLGFPGVSVGKESACKTGNTGDTGLIPGTGRSPGGGHGNVFQYSCLENLIDKGASQSSSWDLKRIRHNQGTKHSCTLSRSSSQSHDKLVHLTSTY